jgi:hypothetical protein
MCQDFQMAFPLARFVVAATQRRAESAFEPREDAFGLPTLAELPAMKAADHLSSIALPGPLARASAVEGDYRRADAQMFPGHAVVGFRVIAAVAQQAVDVQVPACRQHRRRKERRIVTGPDARGGGGDQVGGVVADDRELGMLGMAVTAVAVALAAGVMGGAQRRRQTRGIDARFGLEFDQARLISIREDRAQQAFKAPFFASLRRAWKSVVGCGSFLSSSVWRRSERSSNNATMPRSSVLKNCSRAKTANNWCWVKSFLEYFEEYAGIAARATCKAVLANATGERVETRRLMVSISNCTKYTHKGSKDFSRAVLDVRR